jgi:hypothetical protein
MIASLALIETGVGIPLAVAGFTVGGSGVVGGIATIADAFSKDEHFTGTPIQAVVGTAVAATTGSEEATDKAITWTGYGETAVSVAVSVTQIGVEINNLRHAQAGVDVSKQLHQIAVPKTHSTAGRIGGYVASRNHQLAILEKDLIKESITYSMNAAVAFVKGKI